MIVAFRRLFLLSLLASAACAAWFVVRRRGETVPATPGPSAPDRPASRFDDVPLAFTQLTDDMPVAEDLSVASDPPVADAVEKWVPPVGGVNPEGYPIKANKSGIFHVPGGRFYDRTIPERCYAYAADAEADGYRRSKA